MLYWLNGPLHGGSESRRLSADNLSHGSSLPHVSLRIPGALAGIITDCCDYRRKGPASGHLFLLTDGLPHVHIHIVPRHPCPHFAEAESSQKEAEDNRLPGNMEQSP